MTESPDAPPSSPEALEEWQEILDAEGIDAALSTLADKFQDVRDLHKLFEVRQMQVRQRVGLAPHCPPNVSALSPEQQNKLELGLVDACREVGLALLDAEQLGEAWMYLRAVGDRPLIAEHLRRLDLKIPSNANTSADEKANEDTAEKRRELTEQAIHLALYEGVDPTWGLNLLLDSHGTCNSITALSGIFPNLDRDSRATVSATMLHHVHREVLDNLHRDMAQRDLSFEPSQTANVGPITQIIAKHPQLVAEQSHHVDLSHLMATMQFARSTQQEPDWIHALDLAEYGQRLAPELLSSSEEPFVDFYPMHRAYFAALLGIDADENVALFAERAKSVDRDQLGTQAAETYVDLLARMNRYSAAATASARLLPPGTPVVGVAPTLLELSQHSGDFSAYLELAKERGDLLAYAQGLLAKA